MPCINRKIGLELIKWGEMMKEYSEVVNVYYDFLMDLNGEDEKVVSAISLLYSYVDLKGMRVHSRDFSRELASIKE